MNAPATAVQPWVAAIQEAEAKFNEIAIPDGNIVRFQREATFAMQRIGADALLQKCEFSSVRNALINVASVGLTLNPAMKLAYLIPRADNKANTMLCCLDISYIGLVKIATDSGGVRAVAATIVRKNDPFTWNGPFERPTHPYDPFASAAARGDIIGVYSTALLPNGTTQIDALSMEDIEKIRSMSKAKSGPWVDWFDEMVKKSVLKRASKLWPRTERLSHAEAILNEHQGNETLIDGATGEIIQMPQSKSAPVSQEQAAPQQTTTGAAAPQAKEEKLMSPSQSRLVAAKLRSAGLTADDLEAAFPGKCFDLEKAKEGQTLFAMSAVNSVLEYIAKHAKN